MKAPFRTILCPTDLSPIGNVAIPTAYLLAAKGGKVHLVHVEEQPDTGNPLYPDEKPKGAPTAAQIEAKRNALRTRLTALIPADAATRGIATQVEVVEGDDVPLAIEAAAKEMKAEVIVLGTYGRAGIARLLHGESMASRLVHRSDLDVILVHSDRP